MSASEVIAEIKKLPREEREKVVSFVNSHQSVLVASDSDQKSSFEDAAKAVFAKHRDLLSKLAQ